MKKLTVVWLALAGLSALSGCVAYVHQGPGRRIGAQLDAGAGEFVGGEGG